MVDNIEFLMHMEVMWGIYSCATNYCECGGMSSEEKSKIERRCGEKDIFK